MDPTCPLYGKEPLPLPKSMEALFPVRFNCFYFPSSLYNTSLSDVGIIVLCFRTGSTRKRTRSSR